MAFCIHSSFCSSTVSPKPLLSPQSQISNRRNLTRSNILKFGSCLALASPTTHDNSIERKDAKYHSSIWDDKYVQSLTSIYQGKTYAKIADKLKKNVREILKKDESLVYKLELVDTLQRLGISYHFKVEIKQILESAYNLYSIYSNEDLYATSLKFRLLRQHGYDIYQEVFNNFVDENGKFKNHLCEDTKAILYLYEASYFSTRGEEIMDEARDFSSNHLKEYIKRVDGQDCLSKLVSHSLELPLHWRVGRLEARWFVDVYEKERNMNLTILQLAKLDFNIVQAVHLEDLKHMSRWWKGTKLGENLSFARDRLMENFLWTVEGNFDPQSQYNRRIITMVNSFITIIDDVYDVYGSWDELKIFTDVIERWDVNDIDELPHYMKVCCLALFNSVNGMAYDALAEQKLNVLPYLKKTWASLCKCYLVEAEWCNNAYIPTLDEYLENAWISISAPTILLHAYLSTSNMLTKEAFEFLESHPNLIRCAAMILRLADDLGTSKAELEKGDNPKSIQCYMHETGVSEEKAREHIHHLISETWKKMNEERVIKDYPFDQSFIDATLNLARMAQCMYQHGDGHGIETLETKDRVLSLLINPIPII